MPVDPALRQLDIDIPSQPQSLVALSLLLAEEQINLQACSALIETDMALAAAVMKAVNSSLYGLKGRVTSVHQAITYLGLREVAAITFEIGLRAAFPPAALLEPVWQRAAERGVLMGRLAAKLSLDAWGAHSAGLFEECGKAVLYRHDSRRYAPLLRAAATDADLVLRERDVFGVSHDALGAAMCETWGLGAAAVASVRHHVAAQATLELPPPARRTVCALSVLAALMARDPNRLETTVPELAPQADLDPTLVLRAVRQVQQLQSDERARQQRHAA